MLYLHPLYVDYFAYFNKNRDYFECHEVLEEYWKDIAPGEKEHILVGLVQLATGMYHWRRGNFTGATRILRKGQRIIEHVQHAATIKLSKQLELLSVIDVQQLLVHVQQAIRASEANEAFHPFCIPLKNEHFKQLVTQRSATLPILDEHFIHHKHMLRDRSEVLIARAEKMGQKQKRS